MKSRLTVSFGEVVDRERRHPSEGVSRHLGASGKEASRIKGVRAFLGRLTLEPGTIGAVPERKFSRVFLGQLILGSGPVGTIGLGWLARGTEPRPKVPTYRINLLSLI